MLTCRAHSKANLIMVQPDTNTVETPWAKNFKLHWCTWRHAGVLDMMSKELSVGKQTDEEVKTPKTNLIFQCWILIELYPPFRQLRHQIQALLFKLLLWHQRTSNKIFCVATLSVATLCFGGCSTIRCDDEGGKLCEKSECTVSFCSDRQEIYDGNETCQMLGPPGNHTSWLAFTIQNWGQGRRCASGCPKVKVLEECAYSFAARDQPPMGESWGIVEEKL
jgi:hypothetical protein